MPYTPIPCDLYDHLEIACMAGEELRIVLRNGEVAIATAVTTRIKSDKTEWLECQRADSSHMEIRLDKIKTFEPTQNKTLFERVTFP